MSGCAEITRQIAYLIFSDTHCAISTVTVVNVMKTEGRLVALLFDDLSQTLKTFCGIYFFNQRAEGG